MPDRDNELAKEYKSTSGTIFTMKTDDDIIERHRVRLTQYNTIILEAKAIFLDRNEMYKDAFVFIGLIGTISTLIGDAIRLKYMVYNGDDYGSKYKEQIRDKLLDIINQAIISIFVLDDDNYRGK
jgi:hypothetical protein